MGRAGRGADNTNAAYGAIPGSSLADVVAKRNAFDGTVINIPWVQLEPRPGTLNVSAIETALSEIRRYNADPQTRVRLRAILRIWAGSNTPDWVKNLDGTPITVYDGGPTERQTYSIGHFWAGGYIGAWRQLQESLAARYDREPLIVQVSNTSCTTDTDEPNALTRFHSRERGVSSIRSLHDAGFTDAAYDRCVLGSAQDYAGWRTTYVNFTLNPVFRLDGTGDYQQPRRDAGFTIRLMAQWRAALGSRGVLANHNLNYPLNRNNVEMYEAMRAQGGEIEFQTHSPRGLDWPNTVKEAVCLGAHSLELWNATNMGGFVDYPTETLIGWANELKTTRSNELCPG